MKYIKLNTVHNFYRLFAERRPRMLNFNDKYFLKKTFR